MKGLKVTYCKKDLIVECVTLAGNMLSSKAWNRLGLKSEKLQCNIHLINKKDKVIVIPYSYALYKNDIVLTVDLNNHNLIEHSFTNDEILSALNEQKTI